MGRTRRHARGGRPACVALMCTWVLLWGVGMPVEGSRTLLAGRPFPNRAEPDYTVYHRKQDLLAQVEQIVKQHPDIMAIEFRKAGDVTYNMTMQVVHVEPAGIATVSSGSPTTPKARVFLDFGEHGREFISSELGLAFLQLLADPPALKALAGGGERGDRIHDILRRCVFKILPMENERGRELVESGQLCERKNGRGVDPNRHWGVDWGRKEKDYDPAEEFPGTEPFSEPETRVVLDVATALKPHVWLNVHSGMEAMFTPWDHKAEVANGALEAFKLLESIRDGLFTKDCVVGSGGKSVGYLAHGTATDYMFAKLNVPLAYTWEIYGDMKASFHDCFRMFNPIGRDHVQSVVTLWLKAILRLIELLPSHPALIADGVFSDLQPHVTRDAGSTTTTTTAQAGGDGSTVKPGAGSASNGAGQQPAVAELSRLRGREGERSQAGGPGPVQTVTVHPGLPGQSSATNALLGLAVVALFVFVAYRWSQQRSSSSMMKGQAQVRSWGP